DLPGPLQPSGLLLVFRGHQTTSLPQMLSYDRTGAGCQNRDVPGQRQLVLIDDQGQEGSSSLPFVTAAAIRHGDTAPRTGHRDTTDALAPSTEATASANDESAAAGGTGSTPTSTNSA